MARRQWESLHESLEKRLAGIKLEPLCQASLLAAITKDHKEVAVSFAKLVDTQRNVQNASLVSNQKERLENRIAMAVQSRRKALLEKGQPFRSLFRSRKSGGELRIP